RAGGAGGFPDRVNLGPKPLDEMPGELSRRRWSPRAQQIAGCDAEGAQSECRQEPRRERAARNAIRIGEIAQKSGRIDDTEVERHRKVRPAESLEKFRQGLLHASHAEAVKRRLAAPGMQ